LRVQGPHARLAGHDVSRLQRGARDFPQLINNGGWVDLFAVVDYDGSHRVIKTMRYRHDFTDRKFDRYRRDALAMERLTASPEILTM